MKIRVCWIGACFEMQETCFWVGETWRRLRETWRRLGLTSKSRFWVFTCQFRRRRKINDGARVECWIERVGMKNMAETFESIVDKVERV